MSIQNVWIASAAAIAICGAGSAASAANLVKNGDFSAGNTGFTTGYTLTTMTPYLFQNGVHGIYAIEAASAVPGSSVYGDWDNVTTDPSGGDGNVYVADGATTPDTVVWSQTVAVKPNSDYVFSFYGVEISNACCSNASFVATIDGDPVGGLDVDAKWQQGSFIWNSGLNTSAVLSLTDANTSGPYNDFDVTDIALNGAAPVPEPATWAMMLAGFGGLGALLRRRRGPRRALTTSGAENH